jgi:hypothetical protein
MDNDLEDILGPEKPNSKKEDKAATDKRLNSLKELLKSDNTEFNADNHMVKNNDLPASQNVAYIDYAKKEEEHRLYASEVINGFITNYIKSEELLNSVKLNSIKNQHIDELSDLELMLRNTKRNLIMVQEAVDGGDMSIEMFKLVIETTKELGARVDARSKHVKNCDAYWEKYAAMFGLENKEEKIIRTNETSPDDKNKTVIIDPTALNALIEAKVKELDNKKKESKKDS